MTDEELITILRISPAPLTNAAADRLEELTRRIAELEEQIEAYEALDVEPGTWTVIDLRKYRIVPHPIRGVTPPPGKPLAMEGGMQL